MPKITYLGHSAFEITEGGKTLLIDPFLAANPNYDWRSKNITDILLTHGHGDHLGSALEIAKAKGATITAVFELALYCEKKGAKANQIALGGWIDRGWFKTIFLPAFHSSSTPEGDYAGVAASILININGTKIYHAGDTCLNREMKTARELYAPEIALLPVGGKFTMDIEHASIAADWLGAKIIIPMHFNTFDMISVDISRFKAFIEAQGKVCKILAVNESLQ